MNRARREEEKQLDQEKDRGTSKQEEGGNVDGLYPVSVVAAAAADGGDDNSDH